MDEPPSSPDGYAEALHHMRELVGKLPPLEAYQEALKKSPTATVIIDAAGTIVFFNQRAEFLFDYSAPEVLGREIELLLPERFREIHRHHRDAWFRQPMDRPMGYNLDLFGIRKGGEEFPVGVELSAIQTAVGKIGIGYVTERIPTGATPHGRHVSPDAG